LFNLNTKDGKILLVKVNFYILLYTITIEL